MSSKIIKIGFILLIIFSLGIFNYEEFQLKKLGNSLEEINSEILNSTQKFKSESIINFLRQEGNKSLRIKIEKLIKKNELCEVRYFGIGITYKFKCKNDSKYFFDTDEEYYLIKILDQLHKEEFLQYEQFVDYRTKLMKLENNWYFVKKDIFYD